MAASRIPLRVRMSLPVLLAVALLVAAPIAQAGSATGSVVVESSASDPAVASALAGAISPTKLCVSGYGWDMTTWQQVSFAESAVGSDGSFVLDLGSAATVWATLQVGACAANRTDWDANVVSTTVYSVTAADGGTLDPITVDVAGGVTGDVTANPSDADLEGLVCVSAYPYYGGGAGGGTSAGGGGDSTGGTTSPTRASPTGQSNAISVYDQPLSASDPGVFSYELTGLTPDTDYLVVFQKCWTSTSAQRVDYKQTVVSGVAGAASQADATVATSVEVTVASLASISGTVTSSTGTLLSGICVNAHTAWNSPVYGWGYATSMGGSFSITGLTPGVYDLDFYACGAGSGGQEGGTPRNAPTSRQSTSPGGSPGSPGMGGASYLQTSVDGVEVGDGEAKTLATPVVMQGAGSITGTVRKADGTTAGYGEVCIWAQIPWSASSGRAWAGAGSFGWASSGFGGTYTISGLKTGSYTITFMPCSPSIDSPAGKVSGKAVVAGSTTSGVDYQFTAPAKISGHVEFKSDGSPAENVCVQAQRKPFDPTSPSFGWGMTDSGGDYLLSGLGTGTYTVSFWPCGMGAGSLIGTAKDVSATAGQTTDAGTTEMEAGGRITGTVLKGDGSPAAGVWVWVSKSAYSWTGGSYGSAMTDGSGQFTVDGLTTGDFKVGFYAWSSDFTSGDGVIIPSTTATVAALDTDNPIDASCATGPTSNCVQFQTAKSISGTVTTTDGTPVSGACVSVQPADDSWSMGAWGGTITDGSGAYTIPGLAGLTNFVLHVDPCWQSTGQTLATRWYDGRGSRESADTIDLSGGSLTGIDVVLSEAGSIGGIVTGPTGDPAPGVCAVVYTQDQLTQDAPTPIGQAVTDAAGAYTIRGIAPSATDYRLAFQPCGGDNVTELRQEWYDDASTGAASSAVAVTSGLLTTADAQLAAWTAGDQCNPLLFPGGDCKVAAPYTSPVIAPDPDPATDGRVVEVDSPNADASVNVDQDMLNSDSTIEIAPTDESAPENASDPAPSVGGSTSEAITPYIEVTVRQDNEKDAGGNWAVPLDIVIGVPEAAASITDDRLPVYFDESSSTPWKAIPYIGTPDDDATPPTLEAGQQDGYYVTGTGDDREIHVLTRHASTYAIFKAKSGTPTPTPSTKRAQTAKVPTSVKKGKTAKLPAKSVQGLKLTWKSTTTKVCKVAKSKKGVWTVKGLKKGTCKLTGTNAGNGVYLRALFKVSIKVK